MKKLMFSLAMLFVINAYAGEEKYIHQIEIDAWDGSTIAASSTGFYDITLGDYRPEGFASLQVEISGSGTLKIEQTTSNDGLTFNEPSGASDIVTALTTGSAIYPFDLSFAKYLRILLTETGGADSVTITKATLAIQ